MTFAQLSPDLFDMSITLCPSKTQASFVACAVFFVASTGFAACTVRRVGNHQGLKNQLIEPEEGMGQTTGTIRCQERLGGMLKFYYRNAA